MVAVPVFVFAAASTVLQLGKAIMKRCTDRCSMSKTCIGEAEIGGRLNALGSDSRLRWSKRYRGTQGQNWK
jgi:hypothetical protein